MKATDYWLTNSNFLIIIHRLVFKRGGVIGAQHSLPPLDQWNLWFAWGIWGPNLLWAPPHKRKKCKPTGQISDYPLIIMHIFANWYRIPLIYQTMNSAKGQIVKVQNSTGLHCQVVKGLDFKAINDFFFVWLECFVIIFPWFKYSHRRIHQYNKDDFLF